MLEEYPGVRDGLSRTERQILQTVAAGVSTTAAVFRRFRELEEAAFLGDMSFMQIVEGLLAPPHPLLAGSAAAEGHLTITSEGARCLAGELDWVHEAAIDRWIGGVHLAGYRVWRWDGEGLTIDD